MPMSKDFQECLFPNIRAIIDRFGSPFFAYYGPGIRGECRNLKGAFSDVEGFREYYAVKALPNPSILDITHSEEFGSDCSSVMELELSDFVGTRPEDVIFTSNNTSDREFHEALRRKNVIPNLDDISMVKSVQRVCAAGGFEFPSRICFRLNPGEGNANFILGRPQDAKYGIMVSQMIQSYKMAREAGTRIFGIHTMFCSNQRNWRYLVATVKMLLGCCAKLDKELGIRCEFMNMGGGLGINYRPRQQPLDIVRLATEIRKLMSTFKEQHEWVPKLYMESGRYITGPHGVLVTTVINRKDIYKTHIGVDACPVSSMPRHMIYGDGAYHHVTILDPFGRPKKGKREKVNVVGSTCESTDRFATDRFLPVASVGDIAVVEDGGAHSYAMASTYNSRPRPQQLLICDDGIVRQISRAETEEDLWRLIREASKETLKLS